MLGADFATEPGSGSVVGYTSDNICGLILGKRPISTDLHAWHDGNTFTLFVSFGKMEDESTLSSIKYQMTKKDLVSNKLYWHVIHYYFLTPAEDKLEDSSVVS